MTEVSRQGGCFLMARTLLPLTLHKQSQALSIFWLLNCKSTPPSYTKTRYLLYSFVSIIFNTELSFITPPVLSFLSSGLRDSSATMAFKNVTAEHLDRIKEEKQAMRNIASQDDEIPHVHPTGENTRHTALGKFLSAMKHHSNRKVKTSCRRLPATLLSLYQ